MNQPATSHDIRHYRRGFTLVEMLVVIAIMSILMTAGAIGLSGMGGKGVTSGVATAESLFEEARSIAVGQRTVARVLICEDLADKSSANLANRNAYNLKRMVVISAALNADGTPNLNSWVVASRGAVLPDQVFFSEDYSKKDHDNGSGAIDTMPLTTGVKETYKGNYFYYEFNAEGICTTPGASFVIGSGARNIANPTDNPRVTSSGTRDFGGFVVWRNGRTSIFRSPTQISPQIQGLKSGAQF